MSKHTEAPQELPTLDAAELTSVTGGVTSAATDSSATIETALTSLMSSIQDLATAQSGGGMSDMMMPMMMMMMMGGSSSAAPAAEVPVGQVTASGWTRVS